MHRDEHMKYDTIGNFFPPIDHFHRTNLHKFKRWSFYGPNCNNSQAGIVLADGKMNGE